MDKKIDQDATVWKVFVGEGGSELAAFNAECGIFPPNPGSIGYIAIGWAAIGDMRLYKNQPERFAAAFQMLYPHSTKVWLNEVWNFAYVMKDGDFVISTSKNQGYLLVGRVVGEYQSDYDNWESIAKKKTRADLMHLRRVQWLYVIEKSDPMYQLINKSARMAVNRLDITVSEILNIIGH
jgi:predicted Mrr-cat superfamily restriction endonuclease